MFRCFSLSVTIWWAKHCSMRSPQHHLGMEPHPGSILEIPCTGMVTCPKAKIWLGNSIVLFKKKYVDRKYFFLNFVLFN